MNPRFVLWTTRYLSNWEIQKEHWQKEHEISYSLLFQRVGDQEIVFVFAELLFGKPVKRWEGSGAGAQERVQKQRPRLGVTKIRVVAQSIGKGVGLGTAPWSEG